MTEQCSKRFFGSGISFRVAPCSKAVKVYRDGKPYCHIHDPEAVAKRRQTATARHEDESRRRMALRKREEAKQKIAQIAIDHFDQKATIDDLEKAVIEYRELRQP